MVWTLEEALKKDVTNIYEFPSRDITIIKPSCYFNIVLVIVNAFETISEWSMYSNFLSIGIDGENVFYLICPRSLLL